MFTESENIGLTFYIMLFIIKLFYCTLQRYWSIVSGKLEIIRWTFAIEVWEAPTVEPVRADSGFACVQILMLPFAICWAY